MATYTGKNGAVYVGVNAVAEIKDWSLETTSETVSDTVMGDSWVHTSLLSSLGLHLSMLFGMTLTLLVNWR